MGRCKCCGEWFVGSGVEDPDVCWQCAIRVQMQRHVTKVKQALKAERGL